MDQYIIKGGNPLVGEVEIGGAKNAALGILAAAIMTDETVVIEIFRMFRTSTYYWKLSPESVRKWKGWIVTKLRSTVL